ncbi:hypothetical protein ACFLXA_01160 [Chloroflexota bacterium]
MGEQNGILEDSIRNIRELVKASPEELEKTEYLSRGNTIAARYLKGTCIDLLAEVSHYDKIVRAYLTRGILEALIRNISIPRDAETKRYSSQATNGILILKENQVSVKKVLDDIEDFFADYEEAIQQAYTQLKNEFEIRLDETRKLLKQQLGAEVKFYVERQSEFRRSWRKVRTKLNTHYERTLESYKQHLLNSV